MLSDLVYRNVQAVIVDELAKQTDHMDHTIQNSDKKSIAILVFSILTFLGVCGGWIFYLLLYFQVI